MHFWRGMCLVFFARVHRTSKLRSFPNLDHVVDIMIVMWHASVSEGKAHAST